LPHFATENRKSMRLREVIKLCQRIYCEYHSLYCNHYH
jgi:2-oxoglutarate dehydrogenase E1 component